MTIDRKVFRWFVLQKQFSLCRERAVGHCGQLKGRSLLLEDPGDRHEERCSKCDYRCREEWLPAIDLMGLQGVTKVVCGRITLHTILLNVTTEGYKNLFIVMGYVPDNTACFAFMGLQGVVLFYTT